MKPFDQITLRTERLLLRPLAAPDAPALFAVFSDPKVMRYWSSAPWASMDRALEIIAKDRTALPAGEHLRLGIEMAGTAELIGTCSLFNFVPQCKRAEIGYGMSSSFWGKGYMHEALSALLEFGFGELELNRVEADVDPRNAASARCLERLGFVKEGHLRQRWIVEGEVSDSSLYGLLRGEWLATRNTA
ncbi:MAG: GNAT family protein [Rhodoferax sp.]|uniref:GNAT family N-acetyltransferase n=1 Tax=Rhodoferax sp. TaxID=50421 RepID=UPI002601C09A|nr:GNAT family protein [Rhodoferax sp.]MDD5336295.1 GNAT family protein [Rhodoferax sp.]